MNREELMRAQAAHEAAAEACKKALKDLPGRMFADHRSAMSERLPGVGEITVSLSHDGAEVDYSDDRFMAWLRVRYPTEVETVTRVRNLEWLKRLLTRLTPVGDPDEMKPGDAADCMDSEGTIIPGVVWRKGGRYMHASVKIDDGLKRRYAAAAVAYVERGVPMPAIAGPSTQAIEGSATDVALGLSSIE